MGLTPIGAQASELTLNAWSYLLTFFLFLFLTASLIHQNLITFSPFSQTQLLTP
jgi:hypothetical protein